MKQEERPYVTANIDRELYYEVVESIPKLERTRHINNLIRYAKTKMELSKLLYPKLTIASVDKHSMFIRDNPNETAAEVKYEESGPYCHKDKSDGCIHVKYALLVPELAELTFIRKK